MSALELLPGGKLRLGKIPVPAAQGSDWVTIRVEHSGVCGSDLHYLRGHDRPPHTSTVLGHEVVGRVDGGPGAAEVPVGTWVACIPFFVCATCDACLSGHPGNCRSKRGLARDLPGGFAELVSLPARCAAPIPANAEDPSWFILTDGLAVVLKGLETAMEVSDGRRGELLVIGDGSIGLMAAWAARRNGYGAVTLVCKHDGRRELALRIGASSVIDSRRAAELDRRFEVVVEAVGGECSRPYDTAIHAAVVGGTLLLLGVPSATGERWDVRQMAYKELRVTSSNGYAPRHFVEAVDLLSRYGSDFAALLTHSAPLDADAPEWMHDVVVGPDREHVVKAVLSTRSRPHGD